MKITVVGISAIVTEHLDGPSPFDERTGPSDGKVRFLGYGDETDVVRVCWGINGKHEATVRIIMG